MALVRRFGKPTLFITVTCNIQWPDIQESLYPGETAYDRPDICARVFKRKFKLLLEEITDKNVFGEITYYVYTIEQQKRKGLPHAHLLLGLKNVPKSPEEVDKIVWAELPDPENRRLHDAVTRHMIHGPCGALNLNSPCMEPVGDSKKKVCKKAYPMEFAKETVIEDTAFAVYRRRSPADGGRDTVLERRGGNETVDNRWVVPYNPHLLLKMDCHVNVVKVSSIISVKYAFKYITKGEIEKTINQHDNIFSKLHYTEIQYTM